MRALEESGAETQETDAEPDDDHLPVPDDHPYLHIQPTDEELDPESVTTTFERLHQLEPPTEESWLDKLLGTRPRPTIEWLLTTTHDTTDPTVSYYVTIDPPSELDALERNLRTLFPDSYEIDRVDVHPAVDMLQHAAPDPTAPETDETGTATTRSPVAVTFHGQPDRRQDYLTRLTPFARFYDDVDDEETHQVPLSALVETLANAPVPCVYQALLEPLHDLTPDISERERAIEEGRDSFMDQLLAEILGEPEEYTPPASDRRRLEELAAKNGRRAYAVNARVLLCPRDETVQGFASDLTTAFGHVGHTSYDVVGIRADDPHRVRDDIHTRTVTDPEYDSLRNYVPLTQTRSEAIVADPAELGSFCLLDGAALTGAGERALAPTPGERTALPTPPPEQLETYQGRGLPLGVPLSADDTTTDTPLVLPPALQPLHVGWFGKTGSGKSTGLVNAILDNHAATDGADILIDPKGDGMAVEYMRAHYARYGTLENVLYFDCSDVLPALSIFDIRRELAAGVPRPTAVEDAIDHYLEMLAAIMGEERFERAVRSPDVIRYLLKALFDPVHGEDAFAHRDLHDGLRDLQEGHSVPPVSDDDLEALLAGVVAGDENSLEKVLQGVANRIEKIPADRRLARLFNHVPDDETDRQFDLVEYLDEDVVVILDTGDLRAEAQRVLTLVVLSNLWTALRRRARRATDADRDTIAPTPDLPLVNVYLEEAASVAVSDLLQELLAQSRSFGCSLLLATQFPGQLRAEDEAVYRELLNNVSTFVTGNVAIDAQLAQRLATDDMPPERVGNRLRALRRGQWFVTLPAAFDDPEPRPFLVESLPLPPGDPDGPRPLRTDESRLFQQALEDVQRQTREMAGLTLSAPSTVEEDEDDEGDEDKPLDLAGPAASLSSALPLTTRLPRTVTYEGDRHALVCTQCANQYNPHLTGLERAVECCGSMAMVDRDDVPICDLNLKLSPEEREASAYTDRQLAFLQAVYNAQQLRYDSLEYDLLEDTMIRLQEYVGIEKEAIDDLLEADVLAHDTDHPHRLYTVPPAGRSVINEGYREGVDYGHAAGDLEESSEHVLLVEAARRYLEQAYVQNSDSPVSEVVPYYEFKEGPETAMPAAAVMGAESQDLEKTAREYDQRRLDVAGLDDDGEIVVAVEAERINNDYQRAVPDDYDKLAACDPEEAIWVVTRAADAHTILQALNEPLEGDVRVEKTYAETTPPQQFRIDVPGLTDVVPVSRWLDDLE